MVKYIHRMTTPQHAAALDKILALSSMVAADQARYEREQGLTGPRVHLLWVLGLSGPSTQQTIAQALAVTPRNVTGLVDGLVESGHVTREPHPTDRRATLVTPTAVGERAVADLQRGHAELAGQLFGDVAPQRLVAFLAVLDETTARFAALAQEAAR